MTLGEFIRAGASTPWVDGVHDCSMWPADWAMTWGFGDPAATWRGLYSTMDEARELMRDAGGLDVLWSVGLGSIDAVRVAEPQPGDVGVIVVIGEHGPEMIGAIRSEKRWAFLTPKGVAAASAEHVAAWRRPHG